MDDQTAVHMANLLAQYVRDSQSEGMTVGEALGVTVREVLIDVMDTTPLAYQYMFSAQLLNQVGR